MKKEIEAITDRIKTTLTGEPWFGRSVLSILEEIDPAKTSIKPAGEGHSLTELLYHMITWAEFTLKRIEKDPAYDLAASEEIDWRRIDPKTHSWKKGITEFKSIHKKIISLLLKKDDSFLDEKVDFRNYNFRFLLNGLVEHNIYHLGQMAYLSKFLT